MPHEKRTEILDQAYRFFNERRVDEALALMTEDVEWPDVANGVVLHGREGVRPYWMAQFALGSPVVVPARYIDAGDDVVAVVKQRVDDLDGKPLVSEHVVYHRYSFAGDRIRRMTVHGDEGEATS